MIKSRSVLVVPALKQMFLFLFLGLSLGWLLCPALLTPLSLSTVLPRSLLLLVEWRRVAPVAPDEEEDDDEDDGEGLNSVEMPPSSLLGKLLLQILEAAGNILLLLQW